MPNSASEDLIRCNYSKDLFAQLAAVFDYFFLCQADDSDAALRPIIRQAASAHDPRRGY
jgi:hypothetical protein